MSHFDIRRIFSRPSLQSAGATVVAVAVALGVALQGPLIENPAVAPVAKLAEREASGTVASQVAGRKPVASRTAQIAAARTARLARKSTAKLDLPNLDHAYVDKWIGRFTGDLKRSLEIQLKRMDKYDAMISAKAKKHGVPQDLVYLAMIESGGDAKAKSPVGARGLWQFMKPTAKDYGLKSADRSNPEKSTDAAFEYLGDLYERFGSWYLAAAAYNTGQGRVARVLKQVTGKTKGTDADYYRIAPRLSQETRDYVPKLIAAARIAKDPAAYGLVATTTR